jgi:serine protease Do
MPIPETARPARSSRFISQRRLKATLLAGAAAFALVAASFAAYEVRADTAPAQAGHSQSPSTTGDLSQKAAQASVPMPDFVPLVKAVKPAVVSVRVKSRGATAFNGPEGNPFEGTPFQRFFGPFGFNNGPGQNAPQGNAPFGQGQGEGRPMTRALGSGFIISPDGYIVTNNHVVDKAVEVEVVTDDGNTMPAKVVGTDPKTDLALLKVSGRDDLPFVKLGHETPPIGSWVVAMGNPFGLGGTVTSGIVSAHGRDIGNGPYDDFIQIDAPVNRGNSGGPTFDMKGEVIGVNTAIYSPSGGSVGIAFDIPAQTVKTVVTQIREHGHVERGWLGVQVQPVTRAIADSLGLAEAKGALISEPQVGGPASRAGLRSGDVITEVDGRPIKDARDLARTIAAIGPSREVSLSYVRSGKAETMKLTLGTLKDNQKVASSEGSPQSGVGKLGLAVAPASTVEGAGDNGLAVLSVEPNGQAAELGMQAGDVILKVGGKTIASVDDLRSALEKAGSAGKKHSLALVRHNGTEHYVALPAAVG